MRAIQRAVLCFAALFTAVGQAEATVIESFDFESGNLSGWSVLGDATVVDENFWDPPASPSNQQALLRTPDDNTPTPDSVESFLGLNTGTLNSLTSGTPFSGSAIKISTPITVEAGDLLSFDWNFLSNEGTAPFPTRDFAFWSLVNENDTSDQFAALLAEYGTTSVTSSDSVEFAEETGYFTLTHTFLTSGTYSLGFGVMNELFEDPSPPGPYLSGLLIDNVTFTAIPEPGSAILLLGIGACGAAFRTVRRRRAGLVET